MQTRVLTGYRAIPVSSNDRKYSRAVAWRAAPVKVTGSMVLRLSSPIAASTGLRRWSWRSHAVQDVQFTTGAKRDDDTVRAGSKRPIDQLTPVSLPAGRESERAELRAASAFLRQALEDQLCRLHR